MAERLIEGPRLLFATALAVSWLTAVSDVWSSDELPYSRGMRFGMRIPWRSPQLAMAVLTPIFVFALAAFVFRIGQAAAAAAGLTLLAAARRLQVDEWEEGVVVDLGVYYPAASALAAYLAAYLMSAGRPLDLREACGWEAACGVIGAAYALAGYAKWVASGSGWAEGRHLALLVAERAHSGAGWQRSARRWLVGRPRLCTFAAASALAVECAGVGFVVPVLRWPLAAGWAAMHSGAEVFLGYLEPEWILVATSLAWLASG